MITKLLRYINFIIIICLIGISGQLTYRFFTKEVTVEESREFVISEPTFGVEETTEVVFEDVNIQQDSYDDMKEWEIRYPDEDLPDVEGIEKDAYGNYILTQQMFDNPDSLPVGEDGYIVYIFYYDYDSNVLNPMPELYNNYLEYFGLYGG